MSWLFFLQVCLIGHHVRTEFRSSFVVVVVVDVNNKFILFSFSFSLFYRSVCWDIYVSSYVCMHSSLYVCTSSLYACTSSLYACIVLCMYVPALCMYVFVWRYLYKSMYLWKNVRLSECMPLCLDVYPYLCLCLNVSHIKEEANLFSLHLYHHFEEFLACKYVHLSICLCLCKNVCLFVHLSMFMYECMSICLSFYVYVWMYAHLSICLCLCMNVRPFVRRSTFSFIRETNWIHLGSHDQWSYVEGTYCSKIIQNSNKSYVILGLRLNNFVCKTT